MKNAHARILDEFDCIRFHQTKADRLVERRHLIIDILLYINKYMKTGGQSNLTKRPHRRRTWTVQSQSPGFDIFPRIYAY